MSYYMRFVTTDERETSLTMLEEFFKQSDPAYSIVDVQTHAPESGTLTFNNAPYGVIEINKPEDGLFDDEIQELKESLEDAEGKGKKIVSQILRKAKAIIAVQVLFQDRQPEETLSKIDPLWHWLFENRKGLLQVDDEGYYDGTQLILEA